MASSARLVGADELKRKLDKISMPTQGVKGIKVGIVKTAKYPIETMKGRPKRKTSPYVAQVAFWNEFGTRGGRAGGGWGGPIPERPFMRDSVEKFKTDIRVRELLMQVIDPTDAVFQKSTSELLGQVLKGIMQNQITEGKYAPNAPLTVEIKTNQGPAGGKTTPLIDTGLMRNAIDYQIVE